MVRADGEVRCSSDQPPGPAHRHIAIMAEGFQLGRPYYPRPAHGLKHRPISSIRQSKNRRLRRGDARWLARFIPYEPLQKKRRAGKEKGVISPEREEEESRRNFRGIEKRMMTRTWAEETATNKTKRTKTKRPPRRHEGPPHPKNVFSPARWPPTQAAPNSSCWVSVPKFLPLPP